MSFSGKNDGLMADINVTPLVDVMLVLLIIFMVTAPMMVQGVDVSLPQTTAEPLQSEKEHLIITVNEENEVFLNDFRLTVDNLGEKLSKILEGRKDREVFFRADKRVPYGIVAQIMAEIQGAGVEKLGMVTEPLQSGEKKKDKGKKSDK
ncbi:MAG: protein TolR [Deltaproteobacteria bacterium]|nr:MAG: protein TolR [Deltaproteobacteria bacterium]